ncbi:type II secretory pathway, component PulD [Thiovulum sp. ES]|nr:type II secretory pathway, component PulD [Thiovulum sp. ES]
MKTLLIFLSIFTYLSAHNCEDRFFNINSSEKTELSDFLSEIINYCSLNLVVDETTQKKLYKISSEIHIVDKKLDEVLQIVLAENNLFYTLNDDILKVGYVKTETFSLDYISSIRSGNSKTDISIGSDSDDGKSSVGSTIETNSEFDFWDNLKKEISQLLERPEDEFKSVEPIINKKAGLITISGTLKQLKRVEEYLERIQHRLFKQVLIDVNILSVSLKKSAQTGINWDSFYNSLQADGTKVVTSSSISQIISFLKKNGNVKSISNPKIVAINNQPALISVGNEYFYKLNSSETRESSSTSSTIIKDSSVIKSIFAGILLDITAEISDNDKITISVNPSISEATDINFLNTEKTIPPDLTKKQLSTVITVKNGEKAIIGGLITKAQIEKEDSVPLLSHLPLFGKIFLSKEKSFLSEELVIVITPKILD